MLMELKDFATPLVAENRFVKASLGGFQGTGKTLTASILIAGCYRTLKIKQPLLIIDNEKGSRFLIPYFKEHNIETFAKPTTTIADVQQAFKLLHDKKIGFLFIDSLSKIWYRFVEDYKAKNNVKFMSLNHWGKVIPEWQRLFSEPYVEADGNIIFTGRGGYEYEMSVDEETNKKEFVRSGMKMKVSGETPYESDLNLWMSREQEMDGNTLKSVWRECLVLKDRSGLIDGRVFKNPTYKDFEPVIKYLSKVETGKVIGVTSDQNLIQEDDKGYYARKKKKESLLEEITGIFDLHGLSGHSGDVRQLKAVISDKIFETTSMKAIELLDVDRLEQGKRMIKNLMVQLVDFEDFESKLDYIKKTDCSEWDDEVTVGKLLDFKPNNTTSNKKSTKKKTVKKTK